MNTLPIVTKNILIINLLCYFATEVCRRYGVDLNDIFGLHFFMASDFKAYQLFTYMFMHGGFWHMFMNMFAVFMFGRVMEMTWGPKRFIVYYLICGLGAGFIQEIVQYAQYFFDNLSNFQVVNYGGTRIALDAYLNMWNTVGASGAVYGLLLAFGMTYPNERIHLYMLIPIKAKYFVILFGALELFSGFGRTNSGVAHFAHLGGMLFGLLLILYWRRQAHSYGYGSNGLSSFAERVKRWWAKRKQPKMKVHRGGSRDADYSYNARKKEADEEIDRILEKVKRAGYGSLTDEEKRKLFEASKR